MSTQTLHKTGRTLASGVSAAALLAAGMGAAQAQTMEVAADVGFAPFAMEAPEGGYEGFSVDLAHMIAERHPDYEEAEIVDQQWSGIFSGLYAERYDFIIAPTNITADRAEEMLFTEGYMNTGLGFLVQAGNEDEMNGFEDLEGRSVAVNRGSVSDTWATENADEYGFEVQRYDENPDAVQAVMTGRAFANIADIPVVGYAAQQQPQAAVGYTQAGDNQFALPFRPEDTEARNQVERILEEMKMDGSLAELHEEWFGVLPNPNSAMTTIHVGYGPPGFEGYSLEFR